MKKGFIVFVLFSSMAVLATDYYKVNVKRIDSNVYRDTISGALIVTKYCYEYTYGDEAIIKYEGPYSYDNKLIFNSGTSCQIDKIVK